MTKGAAESYALPIGTWADGYSEIGLPVPADARFLSILAHPFQLTHDWMRTFQPARTLWLYATARIRGVEADATNLHQALRTMLNG